MDILTALEYNDELPSLGIIASLLKSKNLSFQDFIQYTKSKKDDKHNFTWLLYQEQFFQRLIEDNSISKNDLKYLFDQIDDYYELQNFNNRNHVLFCHLIESKIIKFRELVDKYCAISNADQESCLYWLLGNSSSFSDVLKKRLVSKDDLKFLFNKIGEKNNLERASGNTSLLYHFVESETVSFRELIDKFTASKHLDETSCICFLLNNTTIFKDLIENNLISDEDCKYLLDSIKTYDELEKFDSQTFLMHRLLENEIITFEELKNKYLTSKVTYRGPELNGETSLYLLLRQRREFDFLSNTSLVSNDSLKTLFGEIKNSHELYALSENSRLLRRLLEEGVVSFKDLVDRYSSTKSSYIQTCLHYLLERKNNHDFKYLTKNSLIFEDDYKYLLNNINNAWSLKNLCENTLLLKFCLEHYLIDDQTIEKFDELVGDPENSQIFPSIRIERDFTFFEYIREKHKKNEELLEITNNYKEISKLQYTNEERRKLFEVIQNSAKAKNTLKQLVDNNLENTYDFEKLMEILTKDDKKKKHRMNF